MTARPSALKRNPWGRRIFIFLLLLGGAYAILLFLLSRFLDPEELAARMEPRIEAAVSREVEIGSAEVSFFPLGMRLTDISLTDPTGLSPYLARVPSVEFQVALIPLLQREIQVRRLVLEGPEALLAVDREGRTNFGDFSTAPSSPSQEEAGPEADEPEVSDSESAQPESGLPFRLALDEIRVTKGMIRYSNTADSTDIHLHPVDLRAAVVQSPEGSWTFRGNTEAGVSVEKWRRADGFSGLSLAISFDLEADPEFQDLEIREAGLGVEGARVEISGSVQGLKDPVRVVSLGIVGAGIPLGRLAAALPDSVRPGGMDAEGRVDLDLRAEGRLGSGSAPRVNGTMGITDLGVRAEDGTRLARNLSADLTLSSDRALEVHALGEVMDGPFTLDGRGSLEGDILLDFQVDMYPDLGLAHHLGDLPRITSLEGRLKVDGRLRGPALSPRDLRFWGSVAPNGILVATSALGVPVGLPGGMASVQGNMASVQNLPLTLGEDTLVVSGEVSNLNAFGLPGRPVGIQASLRGARLNLVELRATPPPDPDLTYGKVAFAHLGGRQVSGNTPEEAARLLNLQRPDSLPLAGELAVALDTLVDARGKTQDLRTTVAFGPGFFRVARASFRRYGGELQANMNLSLGGNELEPFSLQLSVADMEAGSFLEATSPLGEHIRGRLSLSMEVAGAMDRLLLPDLSSLMGSGEFRLLDGGLNENRVTVSLADFLGMDEFRAPAIQDWDTGFILEEGKVRLAESTLDQAPGDPRIGGSVGLNGELDLLSSFTLPSDQLGDFARENLGIAGEIAGRAANRPEVVKAVIRIGGSIISPDLNADPEATAQALRNAVQEELSTEAQNRIREQRERLQERATGFLSNLMQREETPPPGDSIPSDSLAADTIPGDSLRPDSVPSDSLKPDTTRTEGPVPDSLKPDTTGTEGPVPDSLKPDTTGTGGAGAGDPGRRFDSHLFPEEPTQSHSPASRGGGVECRGSATISQGAPRNSSSNQS